MEEDDSDDEQQAAAVAAKAAASAPAVPAPGDQPTNILFLEGLPLDLTSDMLLPLFQQSVPSSACLHSRFQLGSLSPSPAFPQR